MVPYTHKVIINLLLGTYAAGTPIVVTAHIREEGHHVVSAVTGNQETCTTSFHAGEGLDFHVLYGRIIGHADGFQSMTVRQLAYEIFIIAVVNTVTA